MYLPFWKVFFFSVWYYIAYGENLFMIRLETHCHTRYSKDSLLLHSLLYIKCRMCHIDAIAICEHNNILGALKFKEYCSKRKNTKLSYSTLESVRSLRLLEKKL